jgi:hypothetical protein
MRRDQPPHFENAPLFCPLIKNIENLRSTEHRISTLTELVTEKNKPPAKLRLDIKQHSNVEEVAAVFRRTASDSL